MGILPRPSLRFMAMNRRSFLKKSMWAAGGMSLGLGIYAWKVAPYRLEFVERPLPIHGLPKALGGKRLIQISDMHVGNRFPYSYLMESMQKARAYAPELVVYTGVLSVMKTRNNSTNCKR